MRINIELLLLILYGTKIESNEETQCVKPSLFQKVPLVHLKDGTVAKSLEKTVILTCQSACSQISGCKSVNARARADGYFDCDLLSDNTATSGKTLEPLTDSTYYEVTNYKIINIVI